MQNLHIRTNLRVGLGNRLSFSLHHDRPFSTSCLPEKTANLMSQPSAAAGLQVQTQIWAGDCTVDTHPTWKGNFNPNGGFSFWDLDEKSNEVLEALRNSPQAAQVLQQLRVFVEAMQNTPLAFQMVWSASKSSTLINSGLMLVSAILPVSRAWSGKLMIDAILNAVAGKMAPAAGLDLVLPYLVLELNLEIVSSVTSQLRTYYNRLLQSQLATHIHKLILSKAISLDLQFFENPFFYDTLQNARRQADPSALKIVNSSLQIVQQAITLFSLSFVLVRIGSWLPVVLLISAVPAFISQTEYANREFRLISSRAADTRMTHYLESLLTGQGAVKEIKLFGLGDLLLKRYQLLREHFQQEDSANASAHTWAGLGWGTISTIAYYGCYLWTVQRMLAGVITLGDLTMLMASIRQARLSIQSLLESLTRVYQSEKFMDNLTEYLSLQPQLNSPEPGRSISTPILEGIEFKHVSFRYPDSTDYALRDINLQIRPGEHIALVGTNGAGKTTLIKLLTRLYDPCEGQILLDGIDLRAYNLEDLRQRYSVIFQDFVRYHFSMEENIGFGQVENRSDFASIQQAAERVGIAGFIEALPQGYQTMLSRDWEKGQELSGGQWQKVALARAFIRKAEIMVLDEPTAALDAKAEAEIFQAFGELMQGRMAVIISHRFSTVRLVDRIVVLSKGEIVEMGSHSELIDQNGIYEELFTLQAEGYR